MPPNSIARYCKTSNSIKKYTLMLENEFTSLHEGNVCKSSDLDRQCD